MIIKFEEFIYGSGERIKLSIKSYEINLHKYTEK